MRACQEKDCEKVRFARGWCRMHYARWYRHGDTERRQRYDDYPKICQSDDCDRKVEARGLCKLHYNRWERRVKPEQLAEWDRVRRQTEHYREQQRARNQRQRRRVQKAVYNALHAAVRRGEIERLACEVCGDPASQGHHDDYSKPLDVVWLCARHHTDRHLQEAA